MLVSAFHLARWFKWIVFSLILLARSLVSNIYRGFIQLIVKPLYDCFVTLVWIPIVISLRISITLILLPMNIPLRLVFGTSVQELAQYGPSFLNLHIIMTMIQYTMVLLMFGILIGSVTGTILGMIHFYLRIPTIYLDLSNVKDYIMKKINSAVGYIKYLFIRSIQWVKNIVMKPSKTENHTVKKEHKVAPKDDSSIQATVTTSDQVSPEISKGLSTKVKSRKGSVTSVLDVASIMPNDFFQTDNDERKTLVVDIEPNDIVNYDNDKLPHPERRTVYNTPEQSPHNSPTISPQALEEIYNDSSIVDSDPSGLDIWDRFDSLDRDHIQGTTRTDNTTMRTTRVSKKNRKHNGTS
ncbi:hypothetical protein C6P45_002542 [Maudiozyma exigua]|uniref:Uncharacterized protein n=1 Tax=Maudiozyma exigua TaxID=34358 RepID=A0A9P6VVJ1_MAUEX|nr:hypothetical protein C6P45_002542 [Kazachstania exigua]